MPFKLSQQIALKSDIKYRGTVYDLITSHDRNEPQMYSITWKTGGTFVYLEEMLISKEEADKIENELKEKTINKFKEIEKDVVAKI